MSVAKQPEGYHSVTAYLTVRDCAKAIAFYQAAFGAELLLQLDMPSGAIGHAEIKVGDSPIMLADEDPDFGNQSPDSLGGSPVSMMIYVDDVDAEFAKALAAGASEVRAVEDQFYGDRSGTLKDPFGHTWTLATHIEDLSQEEIEQRMQAMMAEEADKDCDA